MRTMYGQHTNIDLGRGRTGATRSRALDDRCERRTSTYVPLQGFQGRHGVSPGGRIAGGSGGTSSRCAPDELP